MGRSEEWGRGFLKNIILIGMPGSGKSTLGILLAKDIQYGYIDSDSVIVAQNGKLLPELIRELGNDGFLDLEARVNDSLRVMRCVIATGGSAIYRGDVIERMKETGIVVYLKIPYEEMERRLGDPGKRGVVLREGYTLRQLYDERAPLYARHADYTVELTDGSVEEAARLIRETIRHEIEE
ncbi:MAG: shikimate kinase [Ruminococcaceae bacterium]|nr:shikimate kinase [Oscillospiraceae bacterium]